MWRQLKVHISHFAVPCWGRREGDRAHMTYGSGRRCPTSADDAVLHHRPPLQVQHAAFWLVRTSGIRRLVEGLSYSCCRAAPIHHQAKSRPFSPARYVGARRSLSPRFVFSLRSCLIDLPLPGFCWLEVQFNGAYRTDEQPSLTRPGQDAL